MDAVQTSAATPAAPARQATGAATAISSDFETFLKMLTTQMQNQDPLNPMDSQQFAVQLATFSSVEQQVLTNDLLESIGGKADQLGLAQMAGWVGMEVRAAAPARFSGAPVTVYPEPEPGADRAVLVVRGEDGEAVQRLEIPASGSAVEWAGVDENGHPLPEGLYRFEVESYQGGAHSGTAAAEVYSPVREVRAAEAGPALLLDGGAEIPAGGVSAVRQPGAAP